MLLTSPGATYLGKPPLCLRGAKTKAGSDPGEPGPTVVAETRGRRGDKIEGTHGVLVRCPLTLSTYHPCGSWGDGSLGLYVPLGALQAFLKESRHWEIGAPILKVGAHPRQRRWWPWPHGRRRPHTWWGTLGRPSSVEAPHLPGLGSHTFADTTIGTGIVPSAEQEAGSRLLVSVSSA